MKYYLSLGSNLGNRRLNLARALTFLRGLGEIEERSSVYETAPVDMEPGAGFFLNLVLLLDTGLRPRELLCAIKGFERQSGRLPSNSEGRYRSRSVDIDILLSGDLTVDEEDLIIPHPRMARRAFVMVPLCEIAPEAYHPVLKKKMTGILEGLQWDGRVERTAVRV